MPKPEVKDLQAMIEKQKEEIAAIDAKIENLESLINDVASLVYHVESRLDNI